MDFRLALRCRRAISPLNRPHEVIDQTYEFLIAERISGRCHHLILSETGCGTDGVGDAPDRLSARQTLVGTMVSRGPDGGTETFLLERQIPSGPRFGGLFLPAEGFLRLFINKGRLHLAGVARQSWAPHYTHSPAGQMMARALPEFPDPVGCVVHFDAVQTDWAGETLPPTLLSPSSVKGNCT